MNDIVRALGLVLVIEGLLYALMPGHVRKMMAMANELPPDVLRFGGLFAVTAGVGLVWLARAVFAAS